MGNISEILDFNNVTKEDILKALEDVKNPDPTLPKVTYDSIIKSQEYLIPFLEGLLKDKVENGVAK